MILNTTADKAVNADKKQDIVADKKLNAVVDNTINTNKRWDTTAEPLMLIKDHITG